MDAHKRTNWGAVMVGLMECKRPRFGVWMTRWHAAKVLAVGPRMVLAMWFTFISYLYIYFIGVGCSLSI